MAHDIPGHQLIIIYAFVPFRVCCYRSCRLTTVSLQLYTQSSQPQIIARICSTPQGAAIELTQRALQYGLLEVSVLCAAIFLSGHAFD